MSGLGGLLQEVSLIATWLMEEPIGIWLGGRLREVLLIGDLTDGGTNQDFG